MLSGAKEILIIVCVLVGLFMLPRLLRRQSSGKTVRPVETRRSNDGLMRLALLLSGIWIALAVVFLNPISGNWPMFLAAGVLPVATGWGLRWVVQGFK